MIKSFINRLYENDPLRLELAEIIVPEQFDQKAAGISKRLGTPVSLAQIREFRCRYTAEIRHRLPGDMRGWFPKKMFWEDGRSMVEWVYLGREEFTDPFYDDTMHRHVPRPVNQLLGFTCPFDLPPPTETLDSVPLAGFIFHVSRCGSTLVSQMLSAVKGHRVLSEPGPIDAVLESRFRNPTTGEGLRAQWLKYLVKVFGHRRSPIDRRLFIKLDSWHIMDLPLIHRTFPNIPILFLHRDPVEVLVSHRRRPGRQMVPGEIPAEWFGCTRTEIRNMPLDVYAVWVLEKFFKTAHHHAKSIRFTTMDYTQLPSALWAVEQNPFGLDFNAGDIQKMKAASAFSSKDPHQRFSNDTHEKQKTAGPELHSMVKEMLWDTYEEFLGSGSVPV